MFIRRSTYKKLLRDLEDLRAEAERERRRLAADRGRGTHASYFPFTHYPFTG